MNGEHLADRIPEVVHGGAWAADETRHLAECDECRSEFDLVQATARLGQDLPPGPDPATIAREVLNRLANRRAVRKRRIWLGGGAGLAAAAVLVLILSRGGDPSSPQPVPMAAESLSIPLPELEGLGPEDLEVVLNGLESPPADDYSMEGLTWHNPGDPELNRMLYPEEM